MSAGERRRILVVDDEEAILETMTFTFEDEYEVLTSPSPEKALALLDEQGPVSVVISDQRMPEMTGVEFLSRVYERHPSTARVILTGFADMDATIRAINDGHVYAYVTKPWEPDDLRQVIRRAVQHHELTVENERLLRELRGANVFLEAVMDQLDVGAVAIDADGMVRETNRPAREYLGLEQDPRGQKLHDLLGAHDLEEVRVAADRVAADEGENFEEVSLRLGTRSLRLRIRVEQLSGPDGSQLGSVILMREISHEPVRMRFEEILSGLARDPQAGRVVLEHAVAELREISSRAQASPIESAGMADLADRVARAVTALENWLAVDQTLASEDFPDAQLLIERMRVAATRWPLRDQLPERVRELARRVESYYDSGENPKRPTL